MTDAMLMDMLGWFWVEEAAFEWRLNPKLGRPASATIHTHLKFVTLDPNYFGRWCKAMGPELFVGPHQGHIIFRPRFFGWRSYGVAGTQSPVGSGIVRLVPGLEGGHSMSVLATRAEQPSNRSVPSVPLFWMV